VVALFDWPMSVWTAGAPAVERTIDESAEPAALAAVRRAQYPVPVVRPSSPMLTTW
jgi:hypothetical protein